MTNDEDLETPRVNHLRFWKNLLSYLLIFIIVAVLVINTTVLLVRGLTNRQIFTRIQSCTAPGHSCYDENARRTGLLIKELEESQVIATFCANRPENDTLAKVQACVVTNMKPGS